MRILHILSAYPDPIAPQTPAGSNLLALIPEHEHKVYSFTRGDWRPGITAISFDDAVGEGHRAIAYGAPPKGLFLERYLDRLAEWIIEDLDRRGLAPDLVHAHKLTIDGLVGERVAARFGAPLMLSIQGNSDCMILAVRRDLRSRWRRIWQSAAVAFPFAPWTERRIVATLGPRQGATLMLPCPTPQDAPIPPQPVGPLFKTAFHITHERSKNAAGLIRAAARAGRSVPDLRLEIIGGGDPAAFLRVARRAERQGEGRVRLLGAAAHAAMPKLLNGAAAFAMVSHRESFGMVYTEALLAGAPCLYSRGRAIDGYLEEGGVVLAADPADDAEIADAMVTLAREEIAFKARLARLMQNGGLDFLRREAIAACYRKGLESVRGAAGAAPARRAEGAPR